MATAYDSWAFGDTGASTTHPGSPAYIEPVFDRCDAADNVARALGREDGVAELVEAVADARGLLNWVAHSAEVPEYLLAQFRALDTLSRQLSVRVDRELAALNGGEA